MNEIEENHRKAMELADHALAARRAGQDGRAMSLFREAMDFERDAADLVVSDGDSEPTRSVLYRSAATLALECQEYREAERLIATALSGQPPDVVAEELRALLDTVYHKWERIERALVAV